MAQTSAKSTNGTASPEYEELSRQIEALKADIAGLTTALGNAGRAERDRLKASANEQAEHMKAAAEDYVREGEKFLQDRPGTSLAIVGAMGFVLGLLMSRK